MFTTYFVVVVDEVVEEVSVDLPFLCFLCLVVVLLMVLLVF